MKTKTLQEKLARSLDQANTKEAHRRPRQAPAPAAERRCTKISVSLFDTDLEKLKGIRAYVLEQRGAVISTSAALKLALRTAPLSPALCQALDQAAAEDGRKW